MLRLSRILQVGLASFLLNGDAMFNYEILSETGEVENIIAASLEFVEQHYPGKYREVDDTAQRTAAKATEVREERNRLLIASDWTQVLDAQVDRPAWATYRQALRDLPDQAGFPFDVVWPEQP